MSKPKYAITVLFRRYFDVFKQVWSIRHTLDSPPRTKDELAFLPAHLELVETPVPAAPKWTARLMWHLL